MKIKIMFTNGYTETFRRSDFPVIPAVGDIIEVIKKGSGFSGESAPLLRIRWF